MKAPVVLGSLLALAGTAAIAESADAATSEADIQADLEQAVCARDWYRAIEVSGTLITSPKITPDYRQQLLDLRHQLYTRAQGRSKGDEILSCAEFKAFLAGTAPATYQGPEPRFSSKTTVHTSVTTTAPLPSPSVTSLTNIWTVGVRVEGNNIKGIVLNNGLTPANNVTLTIRSQQEDFSEDIQTVAIDTVRPWDEAEFVAAFNDAPGSWMIESIEVN
ncbi:hypothetical protein [Leptothoe sp. PORK10 BA2]|jgi:hypothetical protein|uniref:hypothetical protein n=1 Tax=Leptothoe sp. PORK10 BA2 TaxID=3110254 RepID=UPI002B202EAD|nr:hypothetical protein [Leptothoe sp. PORK10 BA2]MEA5466217.1 hypothetical protein [Leptothoe sp. PORK10 BA2]